MLTYNSDVEKDYIQIQILNKMTKNCMKITKSTFIDIGQNGRGNVGGQANLLSSSRGIPPIPPHKGTPGECMHVGVCVCVLESHKFDF